ncbi:MAG: peptide chain release factor family protein [Phycisphaerales bacterium]
MNGESRFISVPAPHPATLEDKDLLASCTVGKGRSGGPGGQNRNKVETLVTLLHDPTGVDSHAGERRSAIENRAVAIKRLRLALAVRLRCPVPLGEIRSPLWVSRCKDSRIVCSVDHRDFASLLAEAMDVIAAAEFDLKRAALRLCCSTSQLIKLLQDHPPAIVAVNAERASRGLHPLK